MKDTWIMVALLATPTLAQRIDGNGHEAELVATCMPVLQDAATGGCLAASSVPTQGMLYPLGPDFFFDPLGLRLGASLIAQGDVFSDGDVAAARVFAGGNAMRSEGLGIGTTSPAADLHVRRGLSPSVILMEGNTESYVQHVVPSPFGDYVATVGIREGTDDLSLRHFFLGGGINLDLSTFSTDSWEFRRRASTATDVEARLTYDGNFSVDGTVSTGGADLAEYYPLAEPVEPGDVVAFSGDGRALERARAGRASRLAGVISSRPGLVLGLSYTRADETGVAPPSLRATLDETYEDPHAERRPAVDELVEAAVDPDVLHEIDLNRRAPLALAGRVPVNVTAENGPIAAGDLLTLSTVPGRAAKAVDAGVVVGTALEPLHAGEGTIVAFVRTGWYAPSQHDAIAELERELEALSGRVERLETRPGRD